MNTAECSYGYGFSNAWQPCQPSWQAEQGWNGPRVGEGGIVAIEKYIIVI